MIAFKFLATGGLGPLSGFAWPVPVGAAPGTWVDVDGPLAVCARGVHVCLSHQLAHWLSDELWQAEVAGDQREGIDCVVVRRARLVRRITAWSDGGAMRLVAAAVDHAAAVVGVSASAAVTGLLDDARLAGDAGYPAVGAYSAALAVARHAADPARAYADERTWQSAWIARELIGAAAAG